MTPPKRPATSAELEEFCRTDGWEQIRETDHVFWQKVLASGEILQTHRSFGAKTTFSQNVFALILRDQLRVSRAAFWNALRTGEPVDRPAAVDEAPTSYPGWVVQGLLGQGVTEAQIREWTPEEAQARLEELWSAPRGQGEESS